MKKILPLSFFRRPTIRVAKDLLGKFIVRQYRGKTIALMITEVEAYDGHDDLASHASRGLTPRTKIMFGPEGRFYVYFSYGMHWLVNIVTGPEHYPAAVLIRAGAYEDRKGAMIPVTGPARLTKFMKIDGTLNGKIASRATGLWLEDRGLKVPRSRIIPGARIGVDYAGPIWKAKLYNFKFNNNERKLNGI
jgi:DNA-3-methyladenine glycosylase